MSIPEAPFGLESFDLEALDRLMAERKNEGYLLNCKRLIFKQMTVYPMRRKN